MSPRKKTAWELPGWIAPLIAAFLAFLVTWGALRTTVSSLQEDVADLKTLVQTVAVLDARTKAQEEKGKAMEAREERMERDLARALERISVLEVRGR